MAIGFRARGQATNAIQIDSGFSNMSLLQKGTATATTPYLYYNLPPLYYVDVVITSTDLPVFAIYCEQPNHIFRSTRVGNTYTFRVITTYQVPFEYFIFTKTSRDLGGVGLRIRNPATRGVVYNSRIKYMKVLNYLVGNYMLPNQPGGSPIVYPGKKVACVQGRYCNEVYVNILTETETYIQYGYGMQANPGGNSVHMTWRDAGVDGPYESGQVQVRDEQSYVYTTLVIDVTGY